MLEDWLREHEGKAVRLVFANGLHAEVTVDEVSPAGPWIRFTGAGGQQGVLSTQAIMLAEPAPSPEARRLAAPVVPGMPAIPRR